MTQQPPGQLGLMHRQRPHLRGEDRVRAALAQPGHPHLREGTCALPARRARPAEVTHVGHAVGHIERGADQQESAIRGDHSHGGHAIELGFSIRGVSLHAGRELAVARHRHQPEMVGTERMQHVKHASRLIIGE